MTLPKINPEPKNWEKRVNPSDLSRVRQNIQADREVTAKEMEAYQLLIQGFEILADLADQKGPGQAAVYRLKISGYQQALERNFRELAVLDELLA